MAREDPLGAVRLPRQRVNPVSAVLRRLGAALLVLAAAYVVVLYGLDGYRDLSTGGPPNALGALYFVTVSLSTTGYGDVVPVTSATRLANVLLITPLRIVFLVILVGTTVEVLVGRSRERLLKERWRAKMTGHTVVIGYGAQGRAAIATLLAGGVPATQIVVVDRRPAAIDEATAAGLTGVQGEGSSRTILEQAGVATARSVVVATGHDDSSMLVTLSARRINPTAPIVASVREVEHVDLSRQSGATAVIASADTAGRLLGAATISPPVGQILSELLYQERGLQVQLRPVAPQEVGRAPAAVVDLVLGVRRSGQLLRFGQVTELMDGDDLIVVSAPGPAAATS